MKITAVLPSESTNNGHNYSPEREMIAAYNVVAHGNGKLHAPITLRIYSPRRNNSGTFYASVWIHGGDHSYAGHAKGKWSSQEAVAQHAIQSSGITLSHSLNGYSDVIDALEAIATALGYEQFMVVRN